MKLVSQEMVDEMVKRAKIQRYERDLRISILHCFWWQRTAQEKKTGRLCLYLKMGR